MNENEQSGCSEEDGSIDVTEGTDVAGTPSDEIQTKDTVEDATDTDGVTDASTDESDIAADDAGAQDSDGEKDSSNDTADDKPAAKPTEMRRTSTSGSSLSDETGDNEDLPQMGDDSRITAAIGMALAGVASIVAGFLTTRRSR